MKRSLSQALERLDPARPEHREWMQRMKAFIFDIDGVVHVMGKPVPGASEAIRSLRTAGKKVLFLTNNAAKTPEGIVEQFAELGIQTQGSEVMTSPIATAYFLKSKGLRGFVYVVGQDSLAKTLEQEGVVPFGAEGDETKSREDANREFTAGMQPPPAEVAAVVVGVDFRFNYYKLARAANYLRQNPNCLFVATNPDPRAKMGGDAIVPAAGAFVEAIATAAGRRPDVVCGKPSESLARLLLEREDLDASTTCMVGDRTDTDIEFGRVVGMETLFVESGSMTLREAESAEPEQLPRFVANSIEVLHELLAAPGQNE